MDQLLISFSHSFFPLLPYCFLHRFSSAGADFFSRPMLALPFVLRRIATVNGGNPNFFVVQAKHYNSAFSIFPYGPKTNKNPNNNQDPLKWAQVITDYFEPLG